MPLGWESNTMYKIRVYMVESASENPVQPHQRTPHPLYETLYWQSQLGRADLTELLATYIYVVGSQCMRTYRTYCTCT